ncbi:MAG: glycosyltransferase family 4 protein [Lachnospiraceae bacterium]|nr:glycosyltransferase family 4 protein [Lachnospiraceae bacterium]
MMKKKEVLVISEYFAPLNSIASIRFTKILKYLSKTKKYHFTVISRKSMDKYDSGMKKELQNMGEYVDVFYIDILDNFIDKLRKKQRQNREQVVSSRNDVKKFKPYMEATLQEKLYKCLNTLKYIYNEQIFVKRGMKCIRAVNIKFDYVISTYGDAGAHLLALKYKKHHKNVKWIADYRDPALTYYRPPIFNFYFNSIISSTIKKAYVITGVAKGALGRCANYKKSKVIINGFDREEVEGLQENSDLFQDKKLHICYTGRIYGGKSDAGVLFRVLKELSDNKEINISDICVDYAGTNFDLLYEQAEAYEVAEILVNHGFVEHLKALEMQRQSDILLVLSWNDDDEEDVLTGKFMEYLMVERQILAIVKGNKKNCLIKKILSESKAGYCYEEARGEEDVDSLKRFIQEKYLEFMREGRISYNGDTVYLNKFSYKTIAKEFGKFLVDK